MSHFEWLLVRLGADYYALLVVNDKRRTVLPQFSGNPSVDTMVEPPDLAPPVSNPSMQIQLAEAAN